MSRNKKIFERHIDLLGYKAIDKVTGFSGVIDNVSFELYGCIQISLRPTVDEKGIIPDGQWFDVTRMDIDLDSRVMPMPDFYEGYIAAGKKGGAIKSKKTNGITRK